jgi:catalase-peroxidase
LAQFWNVSDIDDSRGGTGFERNVYYLMNSWPDNANLDKARLLLFALIKQIERKIWADLMILTVTALSRLVRNISGFAGGRADVWNQRIFMGF